MSQTLMVRFGADTSAAKKAIIELASTVATSAISMATAVHGNIQTVQGLSNMLAALPGLARTAAGGFIAFQAAKIAIDVTTAAMEAAEKQLAALVAIGAKAESSGVGTSFLQGWTAQAKALNVEASTLEGMLKRARDASTIRQGEGGAAATSSMASRLGEQSKAGNVQAADVQAFTDADTQEQRIRVILDLVERLMSEGRQLAALDIAGKMFGADFEEKLRSGVDMVGRMRNALAGITAGPDGRIIPPEEVENAKRITAATEEARRIMADALRPLHEDIARFGQQEALSWAETKVSMAQAVAYGMQLYSITDKIAQKFGEFGNADIWKRINDWLRANDLMDSSIKFHDLETGVEKPTTTAPAEGSPLTLKITPKEDKSNSLLKKPESASKTGSDTSETNAVDSFINSVQRSAAALKAETEAYDLSNKEKRIAVDLAKAQEVAAQNGINLTDAQITRLRNASAATADYRDKLADLEQQQRQNAEAARFFGSAMAESFGSAIFDGAKLTDIIKNLSRQLGQQSLNALMSGTGPLAGLFGTSTKGSEGGNAVGGLAGMAQSALKDFKMSDVMSSLFGGFKANGGPVSAGQAYRINEVGEEWFVPDRDGRIIPARDAAEAERTPGAIRLDTGAAPAPKLNAGDVLASAFGGNRANGGPASAGQAYRINEVGEDWFVPATDGRIIPARDAAEAARTPGAVRLDTGAATPRLQAALSSAFAGLDQPAAGSAMLHSGHEAGRLPASSWGGIVQALAHAPPSAPTGQGNAAPQTARQALAAAFGGFRASGGAVAAGRSYRINELGREWFAPKAGGAGGSPSGEPGGSTMGPGGSDTGARPVVVHFNVTSPDAPSFARSEAQMTGALMRAVQRGMRGS